MQILAALGINHTLFYQFGIFCIALIILNYGFFVPYVSALAKREQQTTGSVEAANEMTEKTQGLRKSFEEKARAINLEIKSIYEGFRKEGSTETERVLTLSKTESQALIDRTRAKVRDEVASVSAKVKIELPALAEAIAAKALSKKA
jgi:F0F1-type ATP synthase membrane subunit b/b'